MEKICKTIVDSMAFLVIGVAVLGIAYPPALTWVGPYIPWMLGLVMFGMGMTLSVDDFKGVLSHPLEVGIGVFAQFLLMPLIAWGLVKAFGLPPELAIGCHCLSGQGGCGPVRVYDHGDYAPGAAGDSRPDLFPGGSLD